MALSPNVVVVNPGELVTAAHLNNIRSNLIRNDDRITRLMDDTGWLNQVSTGNWSGNVNYRRIGSLVVVSFAVSKVGGNIGATDLTIAAMPAAVAPSITLYGLGYVTAPVGFFRLAMVPNGNLNAMQVAVNGSAVISGSIAYPIVLP